MFAESLDSKIINAVTETLYQLDYLVQLRSTHEEYFVSSG